MRDARQLVWGLEEASAAHPGGGGPAPMPCVLGAALQAPAAAPRCREVTGAGAGCSNRGAADAGRETPLRCSAAARSLSP